MIRHRGSLRSQSLVKHTPQPKLCNIILLVHLNTHLKQSIRVSKSSLQRRVTAAYHNFLVCLLHYFEVVCYLSAEVVGRSCKLGGGPELVCGCGIVLVFAFEVAALVGITCEENPISMLLPDSGVPFSPTLTTDSSVSTYPFPSSQHPIEKTQTHQSHSKPPHKKPPPALAPPSPAPPTILA